MNCPVLQQQVDLFAILVTIVVDRGLLASVPPTLEHLDDGLRLQNPYADGMRMMPSDDGLRSLREAVDAGMKSRRFS